MKSTSKGIVYHVGLGCGPIRFSAFRFSNATFANNTGSPLFPPKPHFPQQLQLRFPHLEICRLKKDKSRLMMKECLHSLVGILASFLMLSGKTNGGLLCDTLAICSQELGGVMRFYHYLREFPSSEAAWNSSWKSRCNMRWAHFRCIESSGCTKTDIKVTAQLIKKKAEFMCSPDGEKYFLRLYRDGPSTCLGNSIARMMRDKHHGECKKKHLSGIRGIAVKGERCQKLIAARKCDADFVAEICTEIHRWAIDRDWQAVTEVYYSDCTDSMSQGLSNLTKAEVSWTKERKKQPGQFTFSLS
ncbi:hypothetical protein RRG08_037572 [Elysia crispata]|uniref:Uncharacterized protein n=1 Tax=Elysia crispata TaxID=231223 RepID=A0AAE1B491_9GAST|nr:hypothetical protein RRG08_037572 [Elysia crispata]